MWWMFMTLVGRKRKEWQQNSDQQVENEQTMKWLQLKKEIQMKPKMRMQMMMMMMKRTRRKWARDK